MINRDYSEAFKAPIRQIKGKVEVHTSTDTFNYETFLPSDRLKSISIKRSGENGKFFGFGIAQEATVEILDASAAVSFYGDDVFNIAFQLGENEFEYPFPDFYIAETKRDEKTNNLTITLQDKLFAAGRHTVAELGLTAPYNIQEFVEACAELLGLLVTKTNIGGDTSFYTEYPTGGNFEGTETIRAALNAVAEATQTIYYIRNNYIVFKRLMPSDNEYEITKAATVSLETKGTVYLNNICSVTELGDNVSSSLGYGTTIQYVRDNPFWELREDIGELVDAAYTAMEGAEITPFTCSWRGNFLVEPGDELSLFTKDGFENHRSYLINDTISYSGGYKQTTDWSYTKENELPSSPSSIGDAIKQTYARVDKVNKQIDIVASETSENKENIAALQIKTDSINLSVSNVQKEVENVDKALDAAVSNTNTNMTALENRVNANISAAITQTEAKIELAASNSKKQLDDAIAATGEEMEALESRVDANISAAVTETEAKIELAASNAQTQLNNAVNTTNQNMTDLESRVNANIKVVADDADAAIEIVTGKANANEDAISALQVNTGSISASVSKVEKDLSDSKSSTDEQINELKRQVETQITPEDVTIAIQTEMSKGTDKVITSTGYRFDETGMTVSKSTSDISTQITENGMTVYKGNDEMLTANKDGVKAQDLHATTYLIIGKNSRFEDYGNRTACFWIGIGGNS